MKLAENTVVHCPTEELAVAVLKIAHDAGYKWIAGESLHNNYWHSLGSDMCYRLSKKTGYARYSFYKKKGFNIISAEQFLKDNNIKLKQETMKALKYFQTKTLRVNNVKRDITVAVYLKDSNLYGGYSVRNPTDIQHDSEKAKLIATGRAMNERTNLLKGESVGSLNHRYILKAIAENLLREIELGNIIIRGIR